MPQPTASLSTNVIPVRQIEVIDEDFTLGGGEHSLVPCLGEGLLKLAMEKSCGGLVHIKAHAAPLLGETSQAGKLMTLDRLLKLPDC